MYALARLSKIFQFNMPTARTNKATSQSTDSSNEKNFVHGEVKQIESLQIIFEEIKSELSKNCR